MRTVSRFFGNLPFAADPRTWLHGRAAARGARPRGPLPRRRLSFRQTPTRRQKSPAQL